MTKLYRIIAVLFILLGILIAAKAVGDTWSSITTTEYHPLHCSNNICRTIQADGTLADDIIVRTTTRTRR